MSTSRPPLRILVRLETKSVAIPMSRHDLVHQYHGILKND
jgi:hypothetical protein